MRHATCRTFRALTVLCLLPLLLAACAGPSPGRIDARFVTTEDLNPDPEGQASPIVVRIYQLGSPVAFSNASFFSLYDNDAAELGADLKGKEEIELQPGQELIVARELKPEARFLGILAGYRDIENASWRAVTEVPEGRTLGLVVGFSKDEVTIEPAN